MDKKEFFKKMVDGLRRTLEQTKKVEKDYQSTANDHKGAMGSRYDTFKQEAQFMVTACQRRIHDASESLAFAEMLLAQISSHESDKRISTGSIVTLATQSGEVEMYVLADSGGGMELMYEGKEVMVITPYSPMGKQLVGHEAGEKVRVQIGNRETNYQVVEVF